MKIVLLLLFTMLSVQGFLIRRGRTNRLSPLQLKSNGLTYKSVRITMPDKRQLTLMYDPYEPTVDQILETMIKDEYVDPSIVNHFIDNGLVIATERRRNAALFKPTKLMSNDPEIVKIPVMNEGYIKDTFTNIGTAEEPMYVRCFDAEMMKINLANNMTRDYMEENDFGHKHAFELMLEEEIRFLRSKLVPRLKRDYLTDSPQWRRYINISAARQTLTLPEVAMLHTADCIEPQQDNPHYDVLPGYHGTMPPRLDWSHLADNECYNQNESAHVWPYFNTVPWHRRNLAPFAIIPHVYHFLALNNLFVDRHKKDLDLPYRGVFGEHRTMLVPDGMRMARNVDRGDYYDPAVQLPHGGQIFHAGKFSPFAESAHGPTVPGSIPTEIPDWFKSIAKTKKGPWIFSPDPPDPFELTNRQVTEKQQEQATTLRALRELGLEPEDLDATKAALKREVEQMLEEEQQRGIEALEDGEREQRRAMLSHKKARERDILDAIKEADHYDENYSPINPPKFNYVRQARFETLHNPPVELGYQSVSYASTLPKVAFRPGEGSWIKAFDYKPEVKKPKKRRKLPKRKRERRDRKKKK